MENKTTNKEFLKELGREIVPPLLKSLILAILLLLLGWGISSIDFSTNASSYLVNNPDVKIIATAPFDGIWNFLEYIPEWVFILGIIWFIIFMLIGPPLLTCPIRG